MELVDYVLVTGDRHWRDWVVVGTVLRSLDQPFILVHGDAAGADRIAGAIASHMMMGVEPFPALWDRYGRAAGPRRNVQMLTHVLEKQNLGHSVRVIAFHRDLTKSKGTAHMVKMAKAKGLRVTHVKGRRRHPEDGLYRVQHKNITAGFEIRGGKVVDCAPILRKKLQFWRGIAEKISD